MSEDAARRIAARQHGCNVEDTTIRATDEAWLVTTP